MLLPENTSMQLDPINVQDQTLQRVIMDWTAAKDKVMPLRIKVFVDEQKVPLEEEQDHFDPVCLHIAAITTTGQVIGTGRLLPDGHIGRMAVDIAWRGTGIGGQLLDALVAEGQKRNMDNICLHAQLQAIPFYQKHHFEVDPTVEHFLDGGIEHCMMRLSVA